MRTITVVCDSCGANISVEKSKNFCFCSNCGAELAVSGKETKLLRIDPQRNAARQREIELAYERNKELREKAERRIVSYKKWLKRFGLLLAVSVFLFAYLPSRYKLSDLPDIVGLVPVLGIVAIVGLMIFWGKYMTAKSERNDLENEKITAQPQTVVVKTVKAKDDDEDNSDSKSGSSLASSLISGALVGRGLRKGLKDFGKELTKNK